MDVDADWWMEMEDVCLADLFLFLRIMMNERMGMHGMERASYEQVCDERGL